MKEKYLGLECLSKAINNSTIFDDAILIDIGESSNDFAKNLLENNKNYKSGIIVFNKQTRGRGRQGKTWISEHGSALTFSLILDTQDITLPNLTSLIVAKALHKAIFSYQKIFESKDKLSIKWPNDIYAGEKKIAGILTENIFAKNRLKKQIVGIGLNFGSKDFNLNDLKNAGSIKSVYNFMPDLDDLFLTIINYVEKTLKENFFDYKYMNKHCFLNNKKIVYKNNGIDKTGSVQGINKNGELVIKLKNGNKEIINSGSIELILK